MIVAEIAETLTIYLVKRPAQILSVLFALFSAVGALIFAVDPGDNFRASTYDPRSSISACLSGIDATAMSNAERSLFIPYNRSCLSAAWEGAINSGNLPIFITELEAIVAVTEYMEIPCHDEAHKAGILASTTSPNSLELLIDGTSQRSVCDNGFVHGYIGALARDSMSPDTVRDVIATCDLLSEPGRGSCVHGSGHAVWIVTRAIVPATELCSEYELLIDRRECMAGVFMTILSPQHDPVELPFIVNLSQAMDLFPKMCEDSFASSLLGDDWLLECYQPLGEYLINTGDSKDLSLTGFIERAKIGVSFCAPIDQFHRIFCEYGVFLTTFRNLILLGVTTSPNGPAFDDVCGPLAKSSSTFRACKVAHNARYLVDNFNVDELTL